MKTWLWFCLACMGGVDLSLGQSPTTAELSGSVTDSSDSRVPNAAVTATNISTNTEWRATASELGEYHFVLLPPGVYDVKAQHKDLQSRYARGVLLTVGEAAVVDFRLALGNSGQALDVTASGSLLEGQSTHMSETISHSVLTNAPIDRRELLTFANLLPGVSDSRTVAGFNSFRVPQTLDSGLAISGGNGRGNNITLDGGEINSAAGGVRPMVGQEAVLEFQMSRANYSAENGSARGGVVNIVTRSGTNQRNGSVFGFLRDRDFAATPPFALVLDSTNRLQRMKPDSDRQQFGATLGGSVARNRTFYFLSYEQLRRREGEAVPILTDPSIFSPTPEQQHILTALPALTGTLLRAILTASASTEALFRVNSGIWPFQSDQHQGFLRVDHRLSDRNQLNVRLYATNLYETNRNAAGLTSRSRANIEDDFANSFGAAWTHISSSHLANELRVQFNYADLRTSSVDPYGPDLDIAGFGSFNRDPFLPAESIGRREEIIDNVHFTRARHVIKFGPYFLVRNTHSDSATLFAGRFTFGALPGQALTPALAGTTITALQAFNLGLAQSYQQGFGTPIVSATYPLYAAYIQDAWRVSPSFTLTYGMRWEADNRRAPLPSNRRNLAPRFGFAWSPASRFVIRGGYGIFYSPVEFQIDYAVTALNDHGSSRQITQILSTLDPNAPFAVTGPINIFRQLRDQGVIGIPTPQKPITAGDLAQFGIVVDSTGPRPPFTVRVRNAPDFRNSYAQQASVELQRQAAKDLLLTAGFVYVRGVHLTTSYDANLLPAPRDPVLGIRNWGATPANPSGTAYFRDPSLFQDNIYESGANSWYTGLTLEATRRFGAKIAMTANYTFSKAIDEATDYEPDYQPNDQTCRRCEHALSEFDQRHKFVLYGQWQAPGAFVLAPIFRYNSSHPFNLLAGTELNNDRHNTTDRPLFAGRNIGIGPIYWAVDVRVNRTIRLGERRHLQLMLEAFNLLNHLKYATVNNIVGTTIPAVVHGLDDRNPSQPLGYTSAFDARRIQMGFRFSF
jgi:hypothetical protein